MWRRWAGRGWLVPAIMALLAGSGRAQTVRVRVVEQDGTSAVAGALVSLRVAGGPPLAQTLTDGGGRAALSAPRPGSYVLRADRIGYQGISLGPIALAADTTIDIRMPDVRVLLPELSVRSTKRVCRIAEENGTLLAAVWEEAQKGLNGARLTQRFQPPELEVTTFERDYDRRDRITGERSNTVRRRTARPFATQDPDRLMRDGFVEERNGETWLAAPDAELLLSDAFLEGHCFRVVRGEKADSGLLGLEFEPVRGRNIPDVRGTLWLHRASAELRHLDFRYTNLDRRFRTGNEGGRIGFIRLPTGGWIVSDWVIRMPIVATVRGQSFAGLPEERDSVIGRRETGGTAEVASASTVPVGASVLAGMVFDSVRGRPVEGAVVSISGGSFADTTGPDGRYRIETPTRGNYLVTAAHPSFELFGLGTLSGAARLERGREAELDIATPTLGGIEAGLCQGMQADTAFRGILIGHVRDARGEPLPGGSVTLQWRDGPRVEKAGQNAITIRTGGKEATITADERGMFRICGLPPDVRLWARAPRGMVAEPTAVVLDTARLAIRDLTLVPDSLARARSAVVVAVTAQEGGGPVRDAMVTLAPADDSLRSDAGGVARFPRVRAGRYLVDVRALGYELAEQEITVPDGDTARVLVPLVATAVTLATLEVTGTGPKRVHPMMTGYAERRKEGLGHYIDLDLLKARETSPLTNLLRMSPGVRMIPLLLPCSGFAAATSRSASGVPRRCEGQPLTDACYMSIYVDGAPIWTPLLNEPPPSLDQFRGNDLEAVEIYSGPAQTPAQYSAGGADCGVILIWRRVSP